MSENKRMSFGALREQLRQRVTTTLESGRSATKTWNEHMLAEDAEEQRYGTRWGRSGAVAVPTAIAVGTLGVAIVNGLLATSFNVANTKFTLTADHLVANGLSAILSTANVKGDNGGQKGVVYAGIKSATVDGPLCILVVQKLPIGDYTLIVSADPKGGSAIQISNLIADATDITAKAPSSLNNAILGKSADEVLFNGKSLGGTPGAFGLDLSQGGADLHSAAISAYDGVVSGTLALPNIVIKIVPGKQTNC